MNGPRRHRTPGESAGGRCLLGPLRFQSGPASQSANRSDFRFGGPVHHHADGAPRWRPAAAGGAAGGAPAPAAVVTGRSISGGGGSAMSWGLVLPAARAKVAAAARLPDVRAAAAVYW